VLPWLTVLWGAALVALVVGVLLWLARDDGRRLLSADPLTQRPALLAAMGSGKQLVAGRLSEDDPFGRLVPNPAARVTGRRDGREMVWQPQLPALSVTLRDGSHVVVDSETYGWDGMNWPATERDDGVIHTLAPGAPVLLYGLLYEGELSPDGSGERVARISADFVWHGDRETFLQAQGARLTRQVWIDQWAGVAAFVSAGVALLVPLAGLPGRGRRQR
jgi:hypothetical protein